jgi:RNA polymerase sigma factor (sigma-70 family)
MKSDKILIEEYYHGNEKSFEILFLRHKSHVFSYIQCIVKDRDLANDFFQDTWIKVINSLKAGKYTEQGKFIGWVRFVAKNLIGDYFRKENKLHIQNISDKEYLIDNTVVWDLFTEKIEKQEDNRVIRMLIDKLNPDQRQVLMDVVFEGSSFKEVADKYKISINTALGRKRYAIKNLRTTYHKYQKQLT